jgi:RHS repeat-associated protein
VNTAAYSGAGSSGWHIATTEYDNQGHVVRSLDANDREEALNPTSGAGLSLGLPSNTAEAAEQVSTINVYTANSRDGLPDLTASFGPYHQLELADTTITRGRAFTATSYDESTGDTDPETGHPVDGNGLPTSLHLPVKVVTSASLSADAAATNLTDSRETDTKYYTAADTSTGWTFREPMQTIVDPNGLAVTTTTLYDSATGRATYSRMPSAAGDTANSTAGTTHSIYYAAGTGSGDSACDNHPLWDGLICKTLAGNTTPTSGLPSLVTTWSRSYDYLDRATETDETATPSGGSAVTRASTTVYGFNSMISGNPPTQSSASTLSSTNNYADPAQQTMITAIGSGLGTTVPAQTTTYDNATGLPTAVSNGSISDSTGYDDFGRVVSYNENTSATGAQANPISTSYDPTHGWVTSTSDAHSSTSYSYDAGNEHRGLPTSTSVTVAGTSYNGTFTASYDASGQLATETDPIGVTTTLGRNETGQLVTLTAAKGGAAWLGPDTTTPYETAIPNVFGQLLTDARPAGLQNYSYDSAGRLTQTSDTTTGASCTIRAYGYDADSNRTSSTVYPSLATDGSGACQTSPYSGGSTTSHSYDAADRLLAGGNDAGLVYDTFGRITTVPAADVTGGSALTIGYYSNDLVQSQTQGTTSQCWTLDPEQRFAQYTTFAATSCTGTATATKTNHYDDASSDSPAWIAETADASQWTANISDPTGGLGIVVDQAGNATSQYTDLHGDIIATASTPAGQQPPASPTVAAEYDEFGNPTSGTSNGRYGWLGAKQRSGDDQGGLLLMGVRLYNPLLGRFLQTDPVPGGSANEYDYCSQDPVNASDLDGQMEAKDDSFGAAGPWTWEDWQARQRYAAETQPHAGNAWVGLAHRIVGFFSWRDDINGVREASHRHWHKAVNDFLGGSGTSVGARYGKLYGGAGRHAFRGGTWWRLVRSGGRHATRIFGWPVGIAATIIDYAWK